MIKQEVCEDCGREEKWHPDIDVEQRRYKKPTMICKKFKAKNHSPQVDSVTEARESPSKTCSTHVKPEGSFNLSEKIVESWDERKGHGLIPSEDVKEAVRRLKMVLEESLNLKQYIRLCKAIDKIMGEKLR